MSKVKRRAIRAIAAELQSALKCETADIIAIGDLLIEAQETIGHGAWLPWLAFNFGSSKSTAENYMNAARVAAKFPTVGNLKLRPTALYLLGSKLDAPDDLFSPAAVAAILKTAATQWVNGQRAHDIAYAMRPPPARSTVEERRLVMEEVEQRRLAMEEAQRAAAEQEKEIEDILDGPPPELPPPQAVTYDPVLPQFDRALDALLQVSTKPLASFVASAHPPDKVRTIVAFLQAIIALKEPESSRGRPDAGQSTGERQ